MQKVQHMIYLKTSIKPVPNNVFSSAFTEAEKKNPEMPAQSPPKYLKCKLLKIHNDSIQLELEKCIMAQRLSKNLSAINKLTTLLGLLRPILYCNVHVANESTKRLTNSTTMNVPEVSEFLPASALQSILMDFKLRGRSTAMLNDALEI